MTSTSRNFSAYIGTENGLFRAPLADRDSKAQLLGLRGKGPVIGAFSDKKDPRRVIAVTQASGVYRSDDGGQLWKEANLGLASKRVTCVHQHARSGALLLANTDTEIYESTSSGESWSLLTSFSSYRHAQNQLVSTTISDIGLHFANQSLIFVSLKNFGFFKSLDKGTSWEQSKSLKNTNINSLLPMSDNPATVICATDSGIYRSLDAGETFLPAKFDLARPEFNLIVGHYSAPNILFSTASKKTNGMETDSAVCMSEDQGQTWKALALGPATSQSLVPKAIALNPEVAKTLLIGTKDGSVWLSEERGDHFRKLLSGLPGIYSIAIF